MNRTITATSALLSALTITVCAGPATAAPRTHIPTSAHQASAKTKTVTGVVFSASGSVVRVVNTRGAIRAYRVAGHLPQALRKGAKVTFLAAGLKARRIKVVGRVRRLSYLARVVRSAGGRLVVSTADGTYVKLATRKGAKVARRTRTARHRSKPHASGDTPAISVSGLMPGQTILVTVGLSPAGEELSISITLVDSSTTPSSAGGAEQLSGTVVDVNPDQGTFTVADANGAQQELALSDALVAASDALPAVCDTVEVTYHADQVDPSTLVADAVSQTGTDTTSADCAPSTAADEVVGAVTAVDAVAGTLTVTPASGAPVTLSADPSDLAALSVGDSVDALYSTADDGTLVLDAIGPADSASR